MELEKINIIGGIDNVYVLSNDVGVKSNDFINLHFDN